MAEDYITGDVAAGLRQLTELVNYPDGDSGSHEFTVRLTSLTNGELKQYFANFMAVDQFLESVRLGIAQHVHDRGGW